MNDIEYKGYKEEKEEKLNRISEYCRVLTNKELSKVIEYLEKFELHPELTEEEKDIMS